MLTGFVLRVPGEAGVALVQRYFEAEHSATAIIHPKTELAPSTPDKRDRRSNPQSASNSSRRVPRGLPPHPAAPAQGLPPDYGHADPRYFRYDPSVHRFPPAQFPHDSGRNRRGGFTNYSMYGHDSFSFRY